MTQDVWLESHPYLRPVADFHAQVAVAVAGIPSGSAHVANWDCFLGDYQAGIPLLWSSPAAINLEPVEAILVSLIESMASTPLPEKLAVECQASGTQLRGELNAPRRAVAWLLGDEAFKPVHPGLLRYLGWTALARFLRELADAFGSWRVEEQWLRSYCPTCGSAPAMSQLVGIDPGRLRLLSCGCCGTRWQFRRIGCPFCKSADDHRLSVLAIEGEKYLRIDYCQFCRAYLKTYDGSGSEQFFLADWTSLHLDIIARDRGLKRLAASLYEL
ncbi:MAG TPA: formate dehydrogenase accessory protein FdhE [Candidatus Sulfotelmatobacter sp.]|nr:formate dehydrogenase accessory protein FdhE [Candidatus Sulfotelmatobacter sp.]